MGGMGWAARHSSPNGGFAMLYEVRYALHGKESRQVGSPAQMRALADYLQRTFRVSVALQRVS